MEISLQIVQIILSITIVVLVLLQTKGAGLGGIFGGGDSGVYRTRRGAEKVIYQATIVLAIIFFVVAMISVSVAA
jgi:preprotein translocase subunit SecG